MSTRSGRIFRRTVSDTEEVQVQEGPGEGQIEVGVTQIALLELLREQQKALAEQRQESRELQRVALEQQQAQQQLLMSMMDQQKGLEERLNKKEADLAMKPKLPKPTLQKLAPGDNNYREFSCYFERIAGQQNWTEEIWATQLARLLTGKVMAAYTALENKEAGKYQAVKKAILHHYEVNEETHRLRFRQDRRWEGESYRSWICREKDHFERWTKDQKMDLKEIMIMEQVLLNVPSNLAVWLRERKPASLEELGVLADDYNLLGKRSLLG